MMVEQDWRVFLAWPEARNREFWPFSNFDILAAAIREVRVQHELPRIVIPRYAGTNVKSATLKILLNAVYITAADLGVKVDIRANPQDGDEMDAEFMNRLVGNVRAVVLAVFPE